MKQRFVLNDIAPDFARDNQSNEDFLERKKAKTISFICDYLLKSGAKGIVLGISGGLDSFVAGALCAEACKKTGKSLHIVSLPNKIQTDYQDALDSIACIKNIYPEAKADTISINGGYKGALADLGPSHLMKENAYVLGNLQARLRMVYQYALADGMLVAGTDHAAENLTGFFTKYGDGGADFTPLQELIKDDIYSLAASFGAPAALHTKRPSAGLGISADDESEMGVQYEDIFAYLRGNVIDQDAARKIEGMYDRTMHKRAVPASMKDEYMRVQPVTHIVVDFIHAFVDGSMALKNAQAAYRASIRYINRYPWHMALYVADSHPKDHCSFQPSGGPWPVHAVKGTQDAAIMPAFYDDVKKTVNSPIARYNVFLKGMRQDEEQYSGYLAQNSTYGLLKDNIAHRVVLSGGATEYCVQQTAIDLLENGHDVALLANALAYVDEEEHAVTLARLASMGARIINA